MLKNVLSTLILNGRGRYFRAGFILSAFPGAEIAIQGKSHIPRAYFSFILRKEVAM